MATIGWVVWGLACLYTLWGTWLTLARFARGRSVHYATPVTYLTLWGALVFFAWTDVSKLHLLWVFPAIHVVWSVIGQTVVGNLRFHVPLGRAFITTLKALWVTLTGKSKFIVDEHGEVRFRDAAVEAEVQAQERADRLEALCAELDGRTMSPRDLAGFLMDAVVLAEVRGESAERHIEGIVSALGMTDVEHTTFLMGLLGRGVWVVRHACGECLAGSDADRVVAELYCMLVSTCEAAFGAAGDAEAVSAEMWARTERYEGLWGMAEVHEREWIVTVAAFRDALGPPGSGWHKLEARGLRDRALEAETKSLAWRLECARRVLSSVEVAD